MARTKFNAPQLQVPWKRVVSILGCATGTTTSASFVNLPSNNLTITVTKTRADTNLVIGIDVSYYVQTTACRLYLGANVGGTDYEVTRRYTNELATYKQAAGVAEITGLAAGSYTVTARIKNDNGAGVISLDTSAAAIMTVEEVKTS